MNVLIVEDEAVAARQLKAMLGRAGEDITVLAMLEGIEATVAYLRQFPRPDLIMLDIELSDEQSFDIFSQVEVTSPVIFTTAYDEYARRAFEVNSVDYLLKPIEEATLRKALSKFRQLRQTYDGSPFTPSTGGLMIPIDELLRQINQYQRPETMFRDRFQVHMLDPRRFYCANWQFTVSHKAVQKVHLYFTSKLKVDLLPATDEEVIISREKAMAFRRWLGK